jgi:hypothetical protein
MSITFSNLHECPALDPVDPAEPEGLIPPKAPIMILITFKLVAFPIYESGINNIDYGTGNKSIKDYIINNNNYRSIVRYILIGTIDAKTVIKSVNHDKNGNISVLYTNNKNLSIEEVLENIFIQRDLIADGEYTNPNTRFAIFRDGKMITRFDIEESSISVSPIEHAGVLPPLIDTEKKEVINNEPIIEPVGKSTALNTPAPGSLQQRVKMHPFDGYSVNNYPIDDEKQNYYKKGSRCVIS